MATDSTNLTFVRCPSCRSLVPAISTRCRMCGAALEPAEGGADAGQARRASRVRQRTMSSPFSELSDAAQQLRKGGAVEGLPGEEASAPLSTHSAGAESVAPSAFGAPSAPATAFGETPKPVSPSGTFGAPAPERRESAVDDPLGAFIEEMDLESSESKEQLPEPELIPEPVLAAEAASPGSVAGSVDLSESAASEIEADEAAEEEDYGDDDFVLEEEEEIEEEISLAPDTAAEESFDDAVETAEESLEEKHSEEIAAAPAVEAETAAVVEDPEPYEAAPVEEDLVEDTGVVASAEFVQEDEEEVSEEEIEEEVDEADAFLSREDDEEAPSTVAVMPEVPEAEEELSPVRPQPSRVIVEQGATRSGALSFGRVSSGAGAGSSAARGSKAEEQWYRPAAQVEERQVSVDEDNEDTSEENEPMETRGERSGHERSEVVERRASRAAVRHEGEGFGRLFGWLVSYSQPEGQGIELREGRFFVSGKSLKESDLLIDDESISTPHAMVTVHAEEGLLVQDLMSDRGVFLRRRGRDTYVREYGIVTVQHGDWVRFGDVEFLVTLIAHVGAE